MSTSDAFDDHVALVQAARASLLPAIGAAGRIVADSLAAGGTCLAFGNGGSAADASHFVAELVGQFDGPRRALRASVLGSDAATLTSISNDLGFERIFARQVEALARPGDIVVAISTSGRSPNVVSAAQTARGLGCGVIGLSADGGGLLAAQCDVLLDVPSTNTQRIQEVHGLCLHLLVDDVQHRLGSGHGVRV